MELLYRVGATICTWQEKVFYRVQYWDTESSVGTLPVRFVRQKPREAYQVRKQDLSEELDECLWERYGEEYERRVERLTAGQEPPPLTVRVSRVWTLEGSICIVELYGGIGGGLAAALRAGCPVKKWIHVERDPVVRKMAQHHALLLAEEYPNQMWETAIPPESEGSVHDVRDITEWVLDEWGQVDVVIAGWQCQGYSRAGEGRGMQDAREASFRDLKRVLDIIHKRQGEVLYIQENVDLAEDQQEPVKRAFAEITEVLGRGVPADVAQLGSRSHRPRRYWQKGIWIAALRHSLAQMQKPEPRLVSDILEPNRMSAPVTCPDHPLLYECNEPGKPQQSLPALVAYEEARGFVIEGELPSPGMFYDVRKGKWEQPTANEREAAMGHLRGAMAHLEVTEQHRRAALGRAMDVNVMMWLLETIRMHLKAKELQRDIAASERNLEFETAEWHRKVLAEMEERYEEQVEEGWAYMALEGTGDGTDDKTAAVEEKTRKEERGLEEDWPLGEGMDRATAAAMLEVLRQHRETFAYMLQELGKCKTHEMKIELNSEVTIYHRKRRMSPGDVDICTEKCEKLMAAGLIQRSESDYAAATVVASRKDLARRSQRGGCVGTTED